VAGSPDLSAITAGITSAYDALGRSTRTQQTSELGTLTASTAYLSGARKQVTDPKGKVTTTTYQVFDQPSYEAVIKVAAPTGLTQTIARDLYGNPLSITQAGPYGTGTVSLTKTLTYDAYHRLCRTTEPESGSEVMAYDGANNLAWSAAGLSLTGSGCGLEQVADAGKTVRTYDAMNRLLTLIPPADTQRTTYGYDALGNLKSAVSGISTWSATRNKLGQLTGETLQLTGQSAWTLGYAHDAYGSLKTLTYPDGTVIGYAPDALGRATQVGTFASGIAYFPNGEVASFTYGNGAAYLAEQNARQLLSNFSYGLGSTLDLSEDYSYDANGNITQVTDLVDGRRTKAFGYDDLNRLTSATASNLWGTESYTYDPLNNIRSRIGNGATFAYNYDASNRLASISGAGSTSFGYDNRGNVTSKNGSTLQFDQKNQLTQIDGLASYSYDAAGRRVAKTPVGADSTYYFYTQAGQLLYQWEPATVKATDFVYLGRKLVARQESYITHVIGNIDGVAIDSVGAATIRGWACSTGMDRSIGVEVFAGGASGAGGTRVATATANLASEPAVATACQASGTSYRFAVPLSATVRQQHQGQPIYMYGDSPVGNGNLVLSQSGKFLMPAPPVSGAPTLTAPANNTTGAYTVSWSAITDATSYTLQEQINSGAWSTVQTGASLSWAASGKGNGTYGYQVQACNSANCGPWSAMATTVVSLPPASAPTVSVPSTSSSGGYTVSWTGVATATSYTLQEQVNGGSWTTIQTGSAISRAISGKGNGTYGYRAQACNSSGCGPWSGTDAIVVTHPPASAPTVSAPASSSTGSYTVSWTAVSTATSYTLQEQVNGGAWTTTYSGAGTSKAISGKGNGTYGYHVRACNVGGCSAWSVTDSTMVGIIPATPAAPHVSVSGVDYKQVVKASWTAVSGATSYQVEMTEPGATLGEVYDNGSNTTFSTITFDPGTYKFRVKACNSVGCSSWSPYGSATVVSGL
jgi:YD repeat-containing protein